MYYRHNNIKFNIAQPFKDIDGTQHPAGAILKRSDLWAANGITEHADEVKPDEALNWVTENPDGTYTATPKTQEELDAELLALKLNYTRHVDADVDDIYRDVIGNRLSEYQLAKEHALSYQAAGYTGTVPPAVASWAAVTGQTAQWAADNILATAAAWAVAQEAIRAQRLSAKAAINAAVDTAGVMDGFAAFEGFEAYIRGQLGV